MMSKDVSSILVPVNGSRHSERAFRWACQSARKHKARLHALHVIEVPLSHSMQSDFTWDVDRAEKVLSDCERIARDEKCRGLAAGHLRARRAGPAIVLEAAVKGADMVVIGIPYNRGFENCVMGETATYIFQNASCQVMLWRDIAPAESSIHPASAGGGDLRLRRNGG